MHDWLERLISHVKKKPCIVVRIDEEQYEYLQTYSKGFTTFTIAKDHSLFSDTKVPTVCLISTCKRCWLSDSGEDEDELYVGVIQSKTRVSTFETRIKINRTVKITPNSERCLLELLNPTFKNLLVKKLNNELFCTSLSSKLSGEIIKVLAQDQYNESAFRAIAESLTNSTTFCSKLAIQTDAVEMALGAFGIGKEENAKYVECDPKKPSALNRIWVMEDTIIQHDARSFPEYNLTKSEITGRATFEKGNDKLEIITANRLPLEQALGVDLIYVNLSKQNVVMVQYKMLEGNQNDDWAYRPDTSLRKEIERMKVFSNKHFPETSEYRFNPNAFYLKFVKRDASVKNGSIIVPLEHYEKILDSPEHHGTRGGIIISYNKLEGRYLRPTAFFNLIQSGYIGSYAKNTEHLKILIEEILNGNKSMVTAIQSTIT